MQPKFEGVRTLIPILVGPLHTVKPGHLPPLHSGHEGFATGIRVIVREADGFKSKHQ